MVIVVNPVGSSRSPQPDASSSDSFIFPLRSRPSLSYKTGGRYFGAPRSYGRKHAGCDLIAPPGTNVLAMADGKVIHSYGFWEGTNALEIKHDNGMIIRYCEISVVSAMTPGTRVSQGQVIAQIKRSNRNTNMLHLEIYKGTSSGQLTQKQNSSNYHYVTPRKYQRRSDLLDPTPYLDGKIDKLQPGEGRVNDRVTSGLNVRSQANTSSSVLFRLNPQTKFKMVDERVTGSSYSPGNRTDWAKIESHGQQGYVAAYYIDYNPKSSPNPNPSLEEYPKPFQKWVEVVARSNLQQQFKIGIIAQSLHESGRGSSELALKANNFNGMHFRNVHEQIDGVTTYRYKGENDWICANTAQVYLDCYLAFIDRDRYQGWRATDTPYNFIKYLFDRGYATDPEYMSKVNKFFQEAENILFFDTSPEEHGWYRIAKCTQDNDYYLVCMAGEEGISKVALDRTVADLSAVLAEMLKKHPNALTWAADTSMDLSGVPLYPPNGPGLDEILTGKRFLLDPGHSQQSAGAQGYAPDYPQEYSHVVHQAEVLATLLRKQGATVDIYDPASDNLSWIGQKAANHDMFISLHLNSSSNYQDHYSCVMIHSSKAKNGSKKFAALCAEKIAKAVDLPLCSKMRHDLPKGVYPDGLAVLSAAENTNCPICVLCESFFIKAMNKNSITRERVEKAAEAICEAIVEWYS